MLNNFWTDPKILVAILIIFMMAIRYFLKNKNKLNLIKNKKLQKEKEDEAIKNILKTMITFIHDESEKENYLSKYKLYCVEELYKSYKKYNGNSFVDDLMEEMKDLRELKKEN